MHSPSNAFRRSARHVSDSDRRLCQLRLARQLTAAAVARRNGVSGSRVRRFGRQLRHCPTLVARHVAAPEAGE